MKQLLITDTSVLLNLLATHCPEEILSTLPYKFLVCQNVLNEALILRNRETQESVEVDLSALIAKSHLSVVELETEDEFELLVDYSALMGKGGHGEAMCFALCESRSLPIAIDDERAIKRAKRRIPNILTVSTYSILQEWQVIGNVASDRMKETLQQIQRWANFHPGPNHPAYSWWSGILA
jgi:predicted nucleic acid-binding protein